MCREAGEGENNMNVISNNTSNLEVYLQRKVQAADELQQSKLDQEKKRQEENDIISISQQGLQTLNNVTQAISGSSPLDSLVEAGTITQDQANAVQSVFQSRGNEIQSSGTYNNRTKRENPLESLVTAGTITEDQKESIQSALKSSMKNNRPNEVDSNVTKTNPLDSLVSAGTITQEQEEAIESAFETAMSGNRF